MAEERTGMVQQDLTDEEWDQRAAKLAEREQDRIDLLAKKKTHNQKWNEELIQARTEIEQLTEEVNTRQAWVPAQTGMFEEPEPANDDEAEAPAGRRRGRGRRAGGRRGGAASEAATA